MSTCPDGVATCPDGVATCPDGVATCKCEEKAADTSNDITAQLCSQTSNEMEMLFHQLVVQRVRDSGKAW